MKVGVFGGCFNPVHKDHLHIATELIANGYVNRVIFVPTGNNYDKKGLIDFEDRVAMLELATGDIPNVSVSRLSGDGRFQYTYQVLDELSRRHEGDEFFFICGTDNVREFETWRRYRYILENYGLLVIRRSGDDVEEMMTRYEQYKSDIIITDVNSGDISSTKVREAIEVGDVDEASEYLTRKVYDYVVFKSIYK